MYLRIRHSTTYRYGGAVQFGPHRLMLRPRDSFDLRVVDTALTISPRARLRWMHDAYGNSVAIANFDAPSDTLDIVSELVVQRFGSCTAPHGDRAVVGVTGVVYTEGERAVLQPYLDLAAADPDGLLDQWLADFPRRIGQGSGHLLRDLAHAIHAGLSYAVRYDEGTQHPADTLRQQAGSCAIMPGCSSSCASDGICCPFRHGIHPRPYARLSRARIDGRSDPRLGGRLHSR